jgi:hypothetical protein
MKNQAFAFRILLILGSFWAVSCSRWEEERPVFPAVPDPLVDWSKDLVLNGSGFAVFKADSGFPADKPYTLEVFGARHGTTRLEGKGLVRFEINNARWIRDSFSVRICREGVCREWRRRVQNAAPILADTQILMPERQPYYLLYASTLVRKLVPDGTNGKLVRIKHRFYTATIQDPDSTRMFYFSGGGTIYNYGYDDIEYLIRKENDQFVRGSFSLIIGDTTEAKARPDSFSLPEGENMIILSGPQIWNNDQNEDGSETQFQIRIQENPDYSSNFEILLPDCRIMDFQENGIQKIRITRTNPLASTVTLPYYLKAGTNGRITRSTIRLRFP